MSMTLLSTHVSVSSSFLELLFIYFIQTGTFAVISLMVGKVVTTYSKDYSDSDVAQQAGYAAIEVATLLCFIVGVMQVSLEIFINFLPSSNFYSII
jgi:hypothetical protein